MRAGIEGVHRNHRKRGRQKRASQCSVQPKYALKYKEKIGNYRKNRIIWKITSMNKDHLAEKGDTARHGNIQEAGISKGVTINENHRPASQRRNVTYPRKGCYSRLAIEDYTIYISYGKDL